MGGLGNAVSKPVFPKALPPKQALMATSSPFNIAQSSLPWKKLSFQISNTRICLQWKQDAHIPFMTTVPCLHVQHSFDGGLSIKNEPHLFHIAYSPPNARGVRGVGSELKAKIIGKSIT